MSGDPEEEEIIVMPPGRMVGAGARTLAVQD